MCQWKKVVSNDPNMRGNSCKLYKDIFRTKRSHDQNDLRNRFPASIVIDPRLGIKSWTLLTLSLLVQDCDGVRRSSTLSTSHKLVLIMSSQAFMAAGWVPEPAAFEYVLN